MGAEQLFERACSLVLEHGFCRVTLRGQLIGVMWEGKHGRIRSWWVKPRSAGFEFERVRLGGWLIG